MTPDPDSNNRVQRRTILRKGAVAAGGITLGTSVLSGSAAAQTVITEPTIIDEPGHYTLGNDILGSIVEPYEYNTAIIIRSSNVTLDGNGHTVRSGAGIWGPGVSNITVQNLTAEGIESIGIGLETQSTVRNVDVRAWEAGVLIRGSGRVIDSSLRSVHAAVECGSNSVVRGNTIHPDPTGSGSGIRLHDADGVTVTGNTLTYGRPLWEPAIDLRNADDNRIANNSVLGDARVGIRIDSDSNNNNVIRNDLRSAETPIEDNGTNTRLAANQTE